MLVISNATNVEFPNDLSTDDTVSSNSIELPADSTLSCTSAEMNECIAETMEVETFTTEYLTVDTISGIDAD